jgi:hypothetical protein
MDISTKWNHSKKAPSSCITVHQGDDPTVEARYIKFSEDNFVDDKLGFYTIDISTRSGYISLYLEHEHIESLVEDLNKAVAESRVAENR